jgi:glyoxylase I family protein
LSTGQTPEYLGIAHASVLVRDTATALAFYRDILGMRLDPARLDLGFPGAWLNIGMQQIHLLELPNPDPTDGRPAHGGRDRHVAINVSDLDVLSARLESASIDFTISRSGRRAIFCHDPDGNALEFIEVTA